MISLRPAAAGDLNAINDIYNYYVTRSTCTYQTVIETMESRQAWFAKHDADHPVIVAVDDVGAVLGWGALTRFHPRQAFSRTVEDSIYVAHDRLGRGIGKRLLADLIERGRAIGHHVIAALIEGEQAPSLRLHETMGFTTAGRLTQVGFKFDRWLDLVYMQLTL